MIRQPIVTVAGHVDHGKCVSGDTLITLPNGDIITAKELFNNNFDYKKAEKIDDGILQNIEEKNLKVFSFDGTKIVEKEISHIWKRKAEKLIEIKLSSGDIIKTTPEHPFFTFGIEKLNEKRADKLSIGEYVAVPKIINIKDHEPIDIIISKLKNLQNFVCFLNEKSSSFLEKIEIEGIKKIEVKLSLKNIKDSIKKKRFRLKDFFKITSYFSINDYESYSLIEKIKNSDERQRAGHTSNCISPPNLRDKELFGYLLGCVAGDGSISNHVFLHNNDLEIQNEYRKCLKEEFGISSLVKQGHTCQMVVNNGGVTFARFLLDAIGFPKKNKSAEIFVPEIAKKNKDIFKGFFAGLFDTDGYVSHLNNSIEITSKSKKLLKECSIVLLNFGIHSVIFSKNSYYTLRIANNEYLGKFLVNFSPRLKRKLERVKNALEKAETSRIFDFVPIECDFIKKLRVGGKINRKVPFFNKYLKVGHFSNKFLFQSLSNLKQENEFSLKLRELLIREISYVKIVSKKEVVNTEDYVYDFTVLDIHNFIAERVIVHNTSLLDKLRGSSVTAGEAGGITQKISFTLFPAENIKKGCYLIDKYNVALEIPGFLFIDTPGHQAFTNLRKRGGSLADMAIVVIDIREGIMPQTSEVLQILRVNKTPFIVALNKIDAISGWKMLDEDLKKNIEKQAQRVHDEFQEKLYTIIAALESHGFKSDLFFEVKDFTQKVCLVPCSAKTGEGIPELLMVLCGLSQKFLSKQLFLGEKAKGVIFEIKKEKAINYVEAILHDGKLKVGDEIAIASFDKPILAKVKSIEEVCPLCDKFKTAKEVKAATGIRLQLTAKQDILPGMPFQIFQDNMQEIEKEFQKVLSEIKTDKQGIIVKADSLGTLEALLILLRQANIKVLKTGIGEINKQDIISAKANKEIDELNAVVLGFNVSIDEQLLTKETKIITGDIIYRLIEDLQKWQEEKRKEIEREKLLGLACICKLEILPKYVFRNSKPAIFGVRISGGKLKAGINLINEQGEKIGRVKGIQIENKRVNEAEAGMEVAVSLPGITFDRQLKDASFLYSELSEQQFREFKKNKELLSSNELKALQEIAEIKRREKITWGI